MHVENKHKEAKYTNDPRQFGMKMQWFGSKTKHISTPERMPEKQKKKMVRLAKDDDGAYFLQIGDLYQFESWLKSESETQTNRQASSDPEKEDAFYGTESIEESLEVAKNGDSEIVKYVQEQARRILLEKKEMIEAPYDVHRDVEGLYHDVGLYLSGEPECFYNEADSLIPDKCLDVHVMCSYNCSINKDDVKERIKYLVAAVSVLEMNGHRVAVHAWWHSEQDSGHPNTNVYKKIKDYRQPINIPTLVGVTHPGFFRRLIFRIEELSGADCWGYGSSYGASDKHVFDLGSSIGSGIDEVLEKIKETNNKK